jgi:serine/threonine protein kinase
VLLSPSGEVRLCDFGLVSTRETTAGTPNYMAPELLEARPFSRKVDVYAFGVLLWEMFVRRLPFGGWRVEDIVRHVSAGRRLEVPRAGATPELVQKLMVDCWA